MDVKRDVTKIQRERELMAVDLEVSLNSLLGGQRDIRQRLKVDERERDSTRDKAKFIIS